MSDGAAFRCIKCRYDLRGIPMDRGRATCPECGLLQSPRPARVPLRLTWVQYAAWMASPLLVLALAVACGAFDQGSAAAGLLGLYLVLVPLWLYVAVGLAGSVVSPLPLRARMARGALLWSALCALPAAVVIRILVEIW